MPLVCRPRLQIPSLQGSVPCSPAVDDTASEYSNASPTDTSSLFDCWSPRSCFTTLTSSEYCPSPPSLITTIERPCVAAASVELSAVAAAPTDPAPAPRSSTTRSRKGKRAPPEGHIPRPPNPWILFRTSMVPQVIRTGESGMHASKTLSVIWAHMSAAERRPWQERAARLKAEHAARHPEYKYAPKTKKTREPERAKKAGSRRAKRVATAPAVVVRTPATKRRTSSRVRSNAAMEAVAGPSHTTSALELHADRFTPARSPSPDVQPEFILSAASSPTPSFGSFEPRLESSSVPEPPTMSTPMPVPSYPDGLRSELDPLMGGYTTNLDSDMAEEPAYVPDVLGLVCDPDTFTPIDEWCTATAPEQSISEFHLAKFRATQESPEGFELVADYWQELWLSRSLSLNTDSMF